MQDKVNQYGKPALLINQEVEVLSLITYSLNLFHGIKHTFTSETRTGHEQRFTRPL